MLLDSFAQLAIGRALIGVGMAVALMSAVKAFTQWFPATRVPLAAYAPLVIAEHPLPVAAGVAGRRVPP